MRKSNVVALVVLVGGAAFSSACAHEPVYSSEPGYGGPGSFGGSSGGPSGDAGGSFETPIQPAFGPTVTAAVPPPPISGGTMLVTHDGHTVVLADPDRDLVYVVDASAHHLLRTITLQAGDEPGRIAEDGAGLVHVALRGAKALATLDPAAGTVLARRPVCPAPRGVAWDETTDTVVVACATGELVTLPSASGAPTRTVTVERDLRDVIIQNGIISVSTFRSAEVLTLASDGSVASRYVGGSGDTASPKGDSGPPNIGSVFRVAWRTFASAEGNTVMLHQLHSTSSLSTQPGGYGSSGVPTAVVSDLTVVTPDGLVVSDDLLLDASLPVDVAISPDGRFALVAAAGNAFTPVRQSALYYPIGNGGNSETMPRLPGAAIAVAFDAAGEALVQTREPAALWLITPGASEGLSISLSSISREDTGHDVFHTQAGAMIACASCHPEGGDDGHVWTLDNESRRTPSLRGTIAGTAPYHWPGDEADLPTLVNAVYTGRMSGAQLDNDVISALDRWVQSIPAPPSPSWVDAPSAVRGQALFEGAAAGCSSCHSGAKLTNNATLDVGTGGNFQVPPLVGVGWRTPLLHDGCAATLEARFTTCATPQHGSTSGLSPQNVSDLVAYLEQL
jgi:cytochrome c553